MIPKTLKTGLLSLLCAMTLSAAISETADAQNPRRGYGVGVAAQGTDMWTQAMSGLRLFTPHRDDCNATTAVFVKVYTNSNSVDFGFCIDKDEHSAGAIQWEDARKECLDDGKRLPEQGEWKYACDSATGLNNMTNNPEWATNFLTHERKPYSNWRSGPNAHTMGNGSCKNASHDWIASTDNVASNQVFRCVR